MGGVRGVMTTESAVAGRSTFVQSAGISCLSAALPTIIISTTTGSNGLPEVACDRIVHCLPLQQRSRVACELLIGHCLDVDEERIAAVTAQLKDEGRALRTIRENAAKLDDRVLEEGLPVEDFKRLQSLAAAKIELSEENIKRLEGQLATLQEMPELVEDIREKLLAPVQSAETAPALHAALQRIFTEFRLSIFRPAGGWPVNDKTKFDTRLYDSPVHPPRVYASDTDSAFDLWLNPVPNPDAVEWVKDAGHFPVASGVAYEPGDTLGGSTRPTAARTRTDNSKGLNGLVM